MADSNITFGAPTVSRVGLTFGFEWERNGSPLMRVQIEDVRNDGDSIYGDFTVWWLWEQPLGVKPVQPFTTLKMNSSHSTGWRSIPRELGKRFPNVDFEGALTWCVDEAMEQFRTGEPSVLLSTGERSNEPPFLLEPWISSRGNTIIYGEGGISKSLLTLAMGLSVATGAPIFGKTPIKTGPVIIFDYEDDHQTHVDRLLALCRSFGIPPSEANIYHHALASRVATAHRDMQRRITETGAVLAILDSVGMARGGSAVAAEDTIRLFKTLRAMSVPFLSIDHVSKAAKADQRKGDDVDPYGSVYTTNSARLGWALRPMHSNDGWIGVYATNQKHNHVPRQSPQTVKMRYRNDERGIPEFIDIETGNEFGMVMPSIDGWQRLKALLHGTAAWWSYSELADELGHPRATIRSWVSRQPEEFTTRLSDTGTADVACACCSEAATGLQQGLATGVENDEIQ